MTEQRPTYHTTADVPAPWARNELINAMRKAGWQRLPGPAAVYESPQGARFHLDECRAPIGVLWRYYAARRELPPAKDAPRRADFRPSAAQRRAKAETRKGPACLGLTTTDVLEFIKRYKAEHGDVAPTRREIVDEMGFASTSTADYHIRKLETAGRIRLEPYKSRWIEVIDEP